MRNIQNLLLISCTIFHAVYSSPLIEISKYHEISDLDYNIEHRPSLKHSNAIFKRQENEDDKKDEDATGIQLEGTWQFIDNVHCHGSGNRLPMGMMRAVMDEYCSNVRSWSVGAIQQSTEYYYQIGDTGSRLLDTDNKKTKVIAKIYWARDSLSDGRIMPTKETLSYLCYQAVKRMTNVGGRCHGENFAGGYCGISPNKGMFNLIFNFDVELADINNGIAPSEDKEGTLTPTDEPPAEE